MPTMRSQRRLKVLGLIVALVVLTILYLTSGARQTRESDFYTRTQLALNERERLANSVNENMAADDDISKRLKAAEERAKKSANHKGDKIQEVVAAGNAEKEKERMSGGSYGGSSSSKDKSGDHDEVTGEKSVAGRVIMKESGKSDGVDGVAKVGNVGDSVKSAASPKNSGDAGETDQPTEEEREADLEINSILKRSPIIIFSKSYCPFSAKAKRILLEEYSIIPAPYVVELDQHTLGSAIQGQLKKSTGRRTVPNILINGKSIGGGDDIEALHVKGKLEETVRSMGGKRIVEAKKADDETRAQKDGLKRRRTKRMIIDA